MGCCSSTEAQRPPQNKETDPLLPPKATSRTTPVDTVDGYRRRNTASSSQNDEQAALSRILHQTANNVIDVSATEPHSVEQQEYRDRQRQYSSRVLTVGSSTRGSSASGGMQLPPGQAAPVEVLASMPIPASDVRFMQSTAAAAAAAVRKIEVKHTEPLVVQLG